MSREARIKSLRRDLGGDTVRRFIKRGIARLPAPLSVKALHARIETWAARQANHLFQTLLHRAFQGEL